jgi:phosphomannomutase/phosphoglucomutase
MVTGSHLKPDQNGFKLSVGARNLYGDDLQLLRAMIDTDIYDTVNIAPLETIDESARALYLGDLAGRLTGHRARLRLHVVVDAGNGVGGLFGPALLRALGCKVTEIFCEPNGAFPNHQPDPSVPDNMTTLAEAVQASGADVGIAFDGDADRMGAVDEKGNFIVADRLLALLARDMLTRNPGAAVVADVLTSQVLFAEVARLGGRPEMWASGHSLVKQRMVELGALIGGEQSGHLFMAEDYYGFDDAFLAAGRLLLLLAREETTLSALDDSLPRLFSTPEYRPHCPDERKAFVIDGVKEALGALGVVNDVDGVRVMFDRGWGLLRASNTEPVLSLRFEGETETDALHYRDLFFTALRAYPEVEAPQV